jgi:hypothetical protein
LGAKSDKIPAKLGKNRHSQGFQSLRRSRVEFATGIIYDAKSGVI